MQRFLCVHGHFYQPPRENPWLEAIEVQDSAYPYHDWNERVTAECYAPNAASRILDREGRIDRIVNNYGCISFDFGPTLLAWLEEKAPEVYRAVLEADRESVKSFNGHGSALMQPYNHTILPLSNRRDKRSQILWGFTDFERRFGRAPEGAWLPEAALDLESLDLLAQAGVRFTVLAPHQAKRVRPRGSRRAADWMEAPGGRIDTTVPYEVALSSGRTIAVFFYDGPTSRAIAFDGLLTNGERFAERLLSSVAANPDRPRLAHVATDGETYGHHHRHGEMALAYALHHIQEKGLARLTNYGEFLAAHPPEQEVELFEHTSWSCAHGVERWRSDCGCHTGGLAGWDQAWRRPLRDALDWLRDDLIPRFEEEAKEHFANPWAARDGYIDVILDRSEESLEAFLARHARGGKPPRGPGRVRALKLLELQRHALLMYTSCGWFFNDLAGIETVQVIQYAGRVVQLAEQLFGDHTEERFLALLEKARSNSPEAGTGRDLYERFVRPAQVDLEQVAAHYAVTSLFQDYPDPAPVYCYRVERENGRLFHAGRARLAAGRARVSSVLTGKTGVYAFGVLHFGDHNLNAAVKPFEDAQELDRFVVEAGDAFEHGDFPQVIRLLDRFFTEVPYSLRSLFRDEQRRVLEQILASTLDEVEADFRELFRHHAPLMRFLKSLGNPLPNAFRAAAEYVLNADLKRAVADPRVELQEIERLLEETRALGVSSDAVVLSFALAQALERLVELVEEHPEDPALLGRMETLVELAHTPPFQVDLWRAQNACYHLRQNALPGFRDRAEAADPAARDWVSRFRSLAGKLSVRVG
jgi:alpha-amylase/alpha-mannosidase (GH57 family)